MGPGTAQKFELTRWASDRYLPAHPLLVNLHYWALDHRQGAGVPLTYDAVSWVRSRRVIGVGGAALAGWLLVARLMSAASMLFADQAPPDRTQKDDKKKKGGDKKGGDKKAKKGK